MIAIDKTRRISYNHTEIRIKSSVLLIKMFDQA